MQMCPVLLLPLLFREYLLVNQVLQSKELLVLYAAK